MFRKGLVVGVIVLFIGVGIQPATSQPNVKNQLSFVNEENENTKIDQIPDYSGSIKRKAYLGCQVKTSNDGIYGLALLFPGILRTLYHSDELLFITMNSGIIIDGAGGRFCLDDDIYEEFLFVNIIGFTGYFEIISNFLRLPKFYLSGTALYVVIYF